MKQSPREKPDVSSAETNGPSLRDLEVFCLVIDLRSFTAAARVTRESKPTISRRIARVEASLEVPLVNRSSRRVEATEEGAAYRARLAGVFELLENANASARRTGTAPSGRLRVTLPPAFGALLAPVFVTFAERYPRVAVESLVTSSVLDLDAEQVDVAFRLGFGLSDSALVARRMLDVGLALVASPLYLRGHTVPRRPEDLRGHRLLFPSLGHEPKWLAQAGAEAAALFRMAPRMASSDIGFTRDLALAGGGIAVLPSASVARDVERGELVSVLAGAMELPKAALYLVQKRTRVPAPKVRAFCDVVVEAFRPRRPGSVSRGAR